MVIATSAQVKSYLAQLMRQVTVDRSKKTIAATMVVKYLMDAFNALHVLGVLTTDAETVGNSAKAFMVTNGFEDVYDVWDVQIGLDAFLDWPISYQGA